MHPTGKRLYVLRRFAWLGVDTVKADLSYPYADYLAYPPR